MSEEFRARLIKHAEQVERVVPNASSEAATRQYLVMPFLQLLGYNPLDPSEVRPEVEASFSEKFKNKADYAILKDDEPVIAIETKKAGCIHEANRGELRGYFNAVPTVKLGILTDGVIYELFSDTGRENMMDDLPFVSVDLSQVAKGSVDDATLDAVMALRKSVFDPAGVGADAKRKIYVSTYAAALERLMQEAPEPFVRVLMDVAEIEGKRTSRLMQEHLPIIREAIQHYTDRVILDRVGFADREDIVRKAAPAPQPEEAPAAVAGSEEQGIETTTTELAVYDYAVRRLAFLITDKHQFDQLSQIRWVDYKTVFCVFFRQERKGRLFNYRTLSDGAHRFEFPHSNAVVECTDLNGIDEELVGAYVQRLTDLP